MENYDISPIVRVPVNDATIIKQVLDMGSEGLIIPMVNSGEEAERAVQACKYPPEGIRGIGPGRATHYGKDRDYLKTANDNILIAVQIEHVRALQNLDAIIAVKGIDVMFIGPADLSASMGLLGQSSHPEVQVAVQKVIDAGKKSGIATGMWCRDEKHAAEMIKAGMQFVTYTNDSGFLSRGIRSSVELFNQCMKELGV